MATYYTRRRHPFRVLVILVVLYTIIGFLVLPLVVQTELVKRASIALGRPVRVGMVRINPYSLSLTLGDLDVGGRKGADSFLGWRRLYVNFDLLGSLRGAWTFSAITLDGFHARILVNPDGSLNFSDLLAKFGGSPGEAPAAAKSGRPFRIEHLTVTDANVNFSDHSRARPFQTVVGPIGFEVTGFRTIGGPGAPYRFTAVSDAGEKFAWTGTVRAAPVHSVGEFTVENLRLSKYAPYYSQALRADVANGTLSVHGHYEVNLDPRARAITLTDGGLSLRNLRINEQESGRSAADLATLDITGLNADGVGMKINADQVALSGGRFSVRREKDGALNWLEMLPASGASGVPIVTASPEPAPSDLQLKVGEVTLNDCAVDVADQAAPRPVHVQLNQLQGAWRNVTLAEGASMPLQFSFQCPPRGLVQAEGSVSIRPALKIALKTKVADLALEPFSPYLEQFIRARLATGSASATTDAQVALADGRTDFTLAGEVHVEKFGVVGEAHAEPLAGFAALDLTGLKFSLAPHPVLDLAAVKLASPYARAEIEPDKSLNLASLMRTTPPTAAGPNRSAGPPPAIAIHRVTITDGDFRFLDRSIEPNVQMSVERFAGTINGLSSAAPGRADLDVKMLINGTGPVAITGRLDPLSANPFVDLTLAARSVDLLPLSPYSGKYAGYDLARGTLSVATTAKLAQQRLAMSDVLTLNHFTFGAPTNSPDAIHLPVRLGVALLKDAKGQIVLHVPVAGSLNDPNFHFGQVAWHAVGNLLTKAAVSPFSLLGSMFGGGGEELAYQQFAPGATMPLPAENRKLGTLVKALTNRPALSLTIRGDYDPAADARALKQQELDDLIRRRIWEVQGAANPDEPPPAQLTITPEEHAAMVKTLFEEKFPSSVKQHATPPPPPVAVAPPAPPPRRPGLFKRTLNVITLKGLRHRHAEKKAQAKADRQRQQAAPAPAPVVIQTPPLEVMTARLEESMPVTDHDLRALAGRRATQVRDDLLKTGKIASDRLILAPPAAIVPAKPGEGPRVFFELQ